MLRFGNTHSQVAWDLAAVFLLTALLVGEAFADSGPAPGAIALATTLGVTLAFRRTLPLSSYLINCVALIALVSWFYEAGWYPLANLIGIYSVGAYAGRGRAVAGLILGLSTAVAYWIIAPAEPIPALPAIVVAGWALAWVAGQAEANRRRAAERAEERAFAAERRREADALVVAAEERSRIAREVHDIVGHSVNVMLLQAGAARQMLQRDPSASAAALQTVESVGRETLGELDGVLALPDAADARRPPPGLADLAALVERFCDAGVPVRLTVEPPDRPLPRAVELSVYRIVQEALTNVAKHTGREAAEVSVTCANDALDLQVTDRGPAKPSAGGGRGLRGIRERVAALGGEMFAGPQPDGGWAVRCSIPLAS